MDVHVAKNRLQALKDRSYFLLILCMGLLVSNIILGLLMGWAMCHQRRTITPAILSHPFTLNDYSVDASYLRQMTLFFVNERLNVTPDVVTQNHALLLHYTDPQFYAGFRALLHQEASAIQKRKIASVFYTDTVKPEPQKLQAIVSGTLKRWVGDVALKPVHKRYRIRYRYHLGRLRIEQFSELGATHD